MGVTAFKKTTCFSNMVNQHKVFHITIQKTNVSLVVHGDIGAAGHGPNESFCCSCDLKDEKNGKLKGLIWTFETFDLQH